MKYKRLVPTLLILGAFALGNCSLPRVTTSPATETPIIVTPTVADSAAPLPTAALGLAENPVILALPPSADSLEQVSAAREIAAQITERTGHVVVTIVPDSYAALIDALENGNAHIAVLDPLSYALAYQKDLVRAQFAVVRNGTIKYGAQFLSARRSGFTSYFNSDIGVNTADAAIALAQFQEKKPCWSDEISPSGYIIPLGLLNQSQVQTRPAAFVGGQTTVVRSIYAGGICDFGATYVDARSFPSLENEYPDLIEQVIVVWQVPEIIPYEVLAFSTQLSQPMRDLFATIIPAILQTDAGNAAFKTAYDFESLLAVNDGDFRDFQLYADESRLDLFLLLSGQ